MLKNFPDSFTDNMRTKTLALGKFGGKVAKKRTNAEHIYGNIPTLDGRRPRALPTRCGGRAPVGCAGHGAYI